MSLLRKTRRSTLKAILVWACLMIPASAFLYSTNGQVRALEKEMNKTAQSVAAEKEGLRVLRAEWAYLNNPQRLSNAAKQYLTGSQIVAATQILPMNRLTAKLALRDAAPKLAARDVQPVAVAANRKVAILARPISFTPSALDMLSGDTNASQATTVAWSQKTNALSGASFIAAPLKASGTP